MDEWAAQLDEEWWGDLDAAVIACLEANGAMAPRDIGRRLGLSESAAASLLCLLVQQGRVRICLVEPGNGARPAGRHARRDTIT